MTLDSATLREGGKALERAAKPHVFPAVVALVALLLVGVLLFWWRQDARDERAAFLQALKDNTAAIGATRAAVEANGDALADIARELDVRPAAPTRRRPRLSSAQ